MIDPGDPADHPDDTRSGDYTARLQRISGVRWKQILRVQAPYHWNLRRWMGVRRTIDVGCGIGRNLARLAPGSVGIDHNGDSVRICRDQGLTAYLPDEFFASADARPGGFEGLLCAHVLEHVEPGGSAELLRPYLGLLGTDARVMLLCPQQRGYASDPTHVAYLDFDALSRVCGEVGLSVVRRQSFPFPAWAGRWFIYNEFVMVAAPGR